MPHAMGATFTEAQKLLENIKICDLQFLKVLLCARSNHKVHSCINIAPLSKSVVFNLGSFAFF